MIQLAAWDVLHRNAKFTQNLATKAWHTEAQTSQILGRIDFLTEPTAGLRAGVAAQERFQAKDAAQLVVQVLTAIMVVPIGQILRRCAKGNGCIEGIAWVLAQEVVIC